MATEQVNTTLPEATEKQIADNDGKGWPARAIEISYDFHASKGDNPAETFGEDAVNHFFGPSSLENEDIVMQLDRTLSELFSFINSTIGLSSTLIILSADHGMAEMPEYMSELGYLN